MLIEPAQSASHSSPSGGFTPPTDMHDAAKGRFWDQLFACHFVREFDRDFLELRSFKKGDSKYMPRISTMTTGWDLGKR
jgi:hypothetical protein